MVNFIMAETWLPREPPSPPTPPTPPRSAARRTLFTWLGLVAAFVILYAVIKRSSDPAYAIGPHDAGASPSWIWLVCLGCLALPTAMFVWLLGGSRKFHAAQVRAFEALGDGQYARAAELFGDLARRFRAKPNLGLIAAFNQGYALIRAGDAEAAVGVLLGIDRWPDLQIDGVRRVAALELARAFAIGGDVDKAQRWLDTARTRRSDFSDPGQEHAMLADVEGLVLCRAGRFEDAIRHYDQTWERLQSRLTVANMRAAWLLRAFAAASISPPRDGAAAETWLGLLRATRPGSLAWLTARWPALARFAAHEIGPARCAPASAPDDAVRPAAG